MTNRDLFYMEEELKQILKDIEKIASDISKKVTKLNDLQNSRDFLEGRIRESKQNTEM